MRKILVCCLGGTIGSKVSDDNTIKLATSPDKSFFEKMKVKAEYKVVTPIMYSSENATIPYFKSALRGIIKAAEDELPDAILVLHGTDSMAHFAQLAVRVLSYMNLPVIITGAKAPIDDPHSDAISNVKFALGILSAAMDGGNGSMTFGVVYSDGFMGQSTFVQAVRTTSADYDGEYKKFRGRGEANILSHDEAEAFLNSEEDKKILSIPSVPGFPYDSIDVTKYDAIVVEAYHSGTADSKKLPELIKAATEKNIKCYLAPVPPHKVPYESEQVLRDAGIIATNDICIEGAWAEAVIG